MMLKFKVSMLILMFAFQCKLIMNEVIYLSKTRNIQVPTKLKCIKICFKINTEKKQKKFE